MDQRSASRHMEGCVTSLGPPQSPQDLGAPQQMLSEVLAASATYGDGDHVQPYQKDLVSWAAKGFSPVPIEEALSPPDREWFGEWTTHLLAPPEEAAAALAESGLEKPYMDPQLAYNSGAYADFLLRLHQAGMLRWKRTMSKSRGSLGVFFVAKNNGYLRIVVDPRLANFSFKAPLSCELPSAHSMIEGP